MLPSRRLVPAARSSPIGGSAIYGIPLAMVPNRPSQTAEAVCLMRATDQRRSPQDRILDDPFARLFLGPMMRAALASWEASGRLGDLAERLSPGLTTFVLCRHRYIDDRLVAALRGGAEQVVVLGAGYDSRAWRFAEALAGRPVFELDFPATSRRKARIVERNAKRLPAAEVRFVEIDFQEQSIGERLTQAGYRRGVKTFFVWEGVAMYLSREAVKAALRAVRELAGAESSLAGDFWYYIDEPSLLSTAYRLSTNFLHFVGEPVTFSIHPEDAGPFLERVGFGLRDLADGSELERRYVRDGRRVPPGVYVLHAVAA